MIPPPARGQRRRKVVHRAVVMTPNGLTLFNLFCGVYAIILAIKGDFMKAPTFIVLGGIADVLDGRVARATGTGSRFGEELDSLVDAISFGLAPALIMYLELPNRGNWEWLLAFIFTACAVMRLARFNVEQAGRKKTHFHGLPSPAAGLTLASYYWFSQTPLYNQTVILFTDSKTLSDLPWPTILRGLMAVLAALMMSDVPYPTVPSIGFKTIRQILGTIVVVGCGVLLVVRREEFIFPAMLAYVLWGAAQWAILGFLGRSARPEEIFWEKEPAEGRSFERRPTSMRSAPSTAPPASDGASAPRRDESREQRQSLERREPRDQPRDQQREARGDEQARGNRRRRRRRGGGGGGGGRGGNPPGGGSAPSSPASNTPSKPDTSSDSST
jgi:CDP-diacylglycerol--serine O-phosphatidyltransferase